MSAEMNRPMVIAQLGPLMKNINLSFIVIDIGKCLKCRSQISDFSGKILNFFLNLQKINIGDMLPNFFEFEFPAFLNFFVFPNFDDFFVLLNSLKIFC